MVGKFGVDHIVQNKLDNAAAKLREDFTTKLAAELQTLRDQSAKQLKALEAGFREEVEKQFEKLRVRSEYGYEFQAVTNEYIT